MPEYLAPGVYIEERPGQRTIEGVSTSTAGFVGMTERGPIEGPPILVTSFGEFQRQFGGHLRPRADAGGEHGHLPLAIQQFFDNGGRRAFVSRAYRQRGDATVNNTARTVMETDARRLTLPTGIVARVRASAPIGVRTVAVGSLRGFSPQAALFSAAGVPTNIAITGANAATNEVLLASDLTAAEGEHRAGVAFVHMAAPAANTGPTLVAREPGLWGERVEVQVRPINGPAVNLAAASPQVAANASATLTVSSTASFYVGCTIEIVAISATGAPTNATYATVTNIAGNVLTVRAPAGGIPAFATPAETWVSVAEVEVLLRWGALVERFSGSWRWIDPAQAPPTGFTAADIVPFNLAHSVWTRINQGSALVAVSEAAAPNTLLLGSNTYDEADPLDSHPTTATGYPTALQPHPTLFVISGQVGQPGTPDAIPGVPDYVGSLAAGPGRRAGIAALTDEETISIVAVPGVTAVGVQSALISHAENLRYRFAVLDGPRDATIAQIRAHRGSFDSKYAAIYYPWIQVTDPLSASGDSIDIPPSGPVIGIYARSDVERGVHKAPANEVVRGALDVVTRVLFGEQEVLNPEGVNVIRDFRPQNRGIRVWGARTISSDPEWKYVNVRRLFIYIESSIDHGTQWVVFEPNNQDLWARVRRTVETFLESTWRTGALFGAKPEDAFYVKCDRSTMSLDDIANGRLVVEIGIAPTRPAEFVIFRISQLTGDARSN
jgi:phage tail sheath protein FI